MSVSIAARSRRPAAVPRGPLLALALLLPMTATFALRAGSIADAGRAPLRLDAEQARRAGVLLEVQSHPELPARLLEVRRNGVARFDDRASILAAAPDGTRVAVAERVGQDPTSLVLADMQGAQLRVPFDGLLAASFAPDGSWLAVSDGLGQLWQVAADDGGAVLLAAGPFAGSLHVEDSGAILALSVPSVEAPYLSRLTRVEPDGEQQLLSDEELVYDVMPLADGSLATVAHRPEGTDLLRLDGGRATLVAELGPGAVHVAVSSDLRVLAWERAGSVYARVGTGQAVLVATGANPRLAADGSLLLVDHANRTSAFTADGSLVAELDGSAVLAHCGGCPS
jgi:hypothetical protein